MNGQPCAMEPEVLQAARAGRLTDGCEKELLAHIAVCPACADLALAARFLNDDNGALPNPGTLPAASFVWWKSQLRARREAAEHAVAPLKAAEYASYAVPLIAILALAAWQFARFTWWLRELLPPGAAARGIADLPSLFDFQSALALASGAALLCLLGFVAYAVLVRD